VVRDVVASAPVPSGCEITIEVPPETVYAFVDPHRITQVVSNLITNACRYTKDDARVSVTLSRIDREAIIGVRDNGIGIPSELLSVVFDMFVQLDTSAPKTDWSLGIGLTLVRSLVELHGGRVEAASQGPGTGSEFRVYLPLDFSKEPESASSTPTGTETEPNGHVVRALVVDDNHDAADMMAALLQSDGHSVQVAYDGGEALETLKNAEIDLVLVDLAMPGIDGFEVARHVRQNPRLNDVCLVAVTGFSQREARERSKAAGFGYHLVKPITASALQDIIAGCGKNRLN
jgi:CheY-like chemotaxis protein